tara:strand:- start:658 stop:1317 length:660 start_codon:yes stop_codon:yes gene_type:complete
MTEQDAIESLVALGNSVSTTPASTPVRCTANAQRTVEIGTPEKSFKAAGYKRVREGLIHVLYESEEGDVMAVPLAKGENSEVFNARRQKTAVMMFDPTRKTAYCQFKNQAVNMAVQDSRWVLFRESMQQKRYHYMNVIQLVVTRSTCAQREDSTCCRNCQNPHFRAGCMTPNSTFYVMPLPMWRNAIDLCNKMLEAFDPVAIDVDTTAWTTKMPQVHVR